MRDVSNFDFGITGFASGFHQDWRHAGSAAEVLANLLGPHTNPHEVEALRTDALSMRSGLTSGEIETLWVEATGKNFWFGPDGDWPSGPGWLSAIIEICDLWFQTHDWPDPQPGLGRDLADSVITEITAMTALLLERKDTGHVVIKALLRCVRECSPDLAFRWSLRIARKHHWPLERGQYERLVALGKQFGYGEFIVSDLEDLVEES